MDNAPLQWISGAACFPHAVHTWRQVLEATAPTTFTAVVLCSLERPFHSPSLPLEISHAAKPYPVVSFPMPQGWAQFHKHSLSFTHSPPPSSSSRSSQLPITGEVELFTPLPLNLSWFRSLCESSCRTWMKVDLQKEITAKIQLL